MIRRTILNATLWILAASAGVCGCASSGPKGASAQDDAQITAQVKAAISMHSDLGPPNQIYVDTREHVVYLTGTVADSLVGSNAVSVARGVAGVDSVVNNTSVDK
jgi:hyperosmotically inducible periplasmic protein